MPDYQLISVGIDLGTTTTQVVFSKLVLRNTSSYFSLPRMDIVEKKVVYTGDVHFTPLTCENIIDNERVRALLEKEYLKAGVSPREVSTGAVIITGESARRENARAVADMLEELAGDFVVTTAGPDLEAVLAGKGSGARDYSEKYSCTVANLDIGGGTTNIAVFSGGEVVAKGCYNIGGRLIKLDEDGVVRHISRSAEIIAQSLGLRIAVGEKADAEQLRRIACRMNDVLEQALGFSPEDEVSKALVTQGSTPLALPRRIDCISFSGGVADCMMTYGGDRLFPYGDIGMLLGRAVAEGKLLRRYKMINPAQTIRATVIGAGSHTINVSGSTVFCDKGVLPLKNLPALCFSKSEEERLFVGEVQLLSDRIRDTLEQSAQSNLLVSLRGEKSPTYQRVKGLAHCLAQGADKALAPELPLLVCLQADMAKALGHQLESLLAGKRSVICIDCVDIQPGDYVDIGVPIGEGLVVPVIVKTLLFG
ncbi:MAG: ethanolamine ammonia-lyase reactivating factor EutA [Oscillospiraceae bacterium]|nr:ethanolamine ammonia-lyase reactivating factor EutA [Oscillospiraceae bacterium]